MRRPQPFTLKPVIKVISFDDLHQRLSFIALDWIFVFFYSSCRPWFCNCSSYSIIFLLHVFTFSTAFQRTRVDYRFLFLFQCFLFLKIFLDVIKFSFQDFSFTKILKKKPENMKPKGPSFDWISLKPYSVFSKWNSESWFFLALCSYWGGNCDFIDFENEIPKIKKSIPNFRASSENVSLVCLFFFINVPDYSIVMAKSTCPKWTRFLANRDYNSLKEWVKENGPTTDFVAGVDVLGHFFGLHVAGVGSTHGATTLLIHFVAHVDWREQKINRVGDSRKE